MRFLFLLLCVLSAEVFAKKPLCTHAVLYVDTAKPLSLHPTQLDIGMRAAEHRRDKILAMHERERELYLIRKAPKVVIGPEGKRYLIDGHHLVFAAYLAGIEELPIRVVADWSQKKHFWRKMRRRGYLHLVDQTGRAHTRDKLPTDILGFGDDEYRSLAYFARRQKAFKKKQKLYSEFAWANFYRMRIPLGEGDAGFEAALRMAVQISLAMDAAYLPGYRGDDNPAPAKN
ncbi:hypothetical protein K2X33_03285 [bacterium]|nr:hypothetical protein [bacterium]